MGHAPIAVSILILILTSSLVPGLSPCPDELDRGEYGNETRSGLASLPSVGGNEDRPGPVGHLSKFNKEKVLHVDCSLN